MALRQGLYDPAYEHDSCGVSFVCDISGTASHRIVALGVKALCNLEHRGALGADAGTGDGAGILIQVPDRFLRDVVSHPLPPAGHYATGIGFLPPDADLAEKAAAQVEAIVASEGLEVIGWRSPPVDDSTLGAGARAAMPRFRQIFVAGTDPAGNDLVGIELDRRAYVVRKRIEHEIGPDAAGVDNEADTVMGAAAPPHRGVYFPSLSARTVVYKGMLTSKQLTSFYPDLLDERVASAMALVHSRFSTNTFPSWPLAHPYRMIAHNGEINTIRGNRNWMRAREALLETPHLSDLERIFPVCTPEASDTAGFDEVLELLTLGGYTPAEAMLMMIPEPWEHHNEMSDERKAFYEYNATRMEPWDGPASIAFTDGTVIGAVLDRNGLRPSRYLVTSDGLVVMASETGVIDVPQSTVVEKGRLRPGRMFLVDTDQGRIVRDDEIKDELATARPYRRWLDRNLIRLQDLPERKPAHREEGTLAQRQQAFGHTHEEHRLLLAPMAANGKEAIGSMGTDTPLAVLSDRSRPIYDYFKQLFAQVTNPPLDAIREELVTSLYARLGPQDNLFDPQPSSCRAVHLDTPVITDAELARLHGIGDLGDPEQSRTAVARIEALRGSVPGQSLTPEESRTLGQSRTPEESLTRGRDRNVMPKGAHDLGGFDELRVRRLPALFEAAAGGDGLRAALQQLREAAVAAIEEGAGILVVSDRGSDERLAPIPSLLAVSAVHQHLVSTRTRTRAGLIAESGDAREVHHLCLLLGYGANAVNPYLALETVGAMTAEGLHGLDPEMGAETAQRNYVKAASAGILKVMSKMGISTVASYTGAQIFEAVGLSSEIVDEYFCGTPSRIEGAGLDEIAAAVAWRHRRAHPRNPTRRAHRTLDAGGEYQWRREGEYHLFNPETVFKLQHATRERRYDIFREYTQLVDDQSRRLGTLRGLFRLRQSDRNPIPVEDVEPVSKIIKRFATGAMSYGSISAEAHETLAIAMNRIGGKSNTGEGGEDPERYIPDANGDLRRSAVKQAASGRFGVTSEYLVNADDIQIKMAQGAKPGEGGQLPGHKVYPWIAKTRHSTPGVGLISPPPHHDIYSIEDLAQLIHDLKNANPRARIHVKLVAEVGVGTVAAGVSKAHADVVLISGHDGGTGASPLTSIKHAGGPWEIGLAETQQTLLLNDLRDRIVVQVDGQLKTGRDVVIAALLGAEEFGFATAPLVVMGCVMMRVCHLDTCPVGVATQNPELRSKFTGQPEFVENFFEFIASEVREHLAALGLRSIEEAVGRADLLDAAEAVDHWKAAGLDLTPILHHPPVEPDSARHCRTIQDHGLDRALDQMLIQLAEGALNDRMPVTIDIPIRNVNRTVGTLLGSEVTRRYGAAGLPDDTIVVSFTGSAGTSFGAFVPRGITLRLEGDANDYVGKGLSGGRIVVRPPVDARFEAEHNVIAGNVIGYGATSGEIYLRGQVGERFCVRNSGAVAVVEGIGDHGCEYMTGGRVVVLGPVGRNFAAGMSGGIAYVHDPDGRLAVRVNPEMVELESLDNGDRIWLRERLRRHRHETASPVAVKLLSAWPASADKFVKVIPTDYKRVLAAFEQARREGVDEVAAVMASAHG